MERHGYPPGAATLILVFAILCLTGSCRDGDSGPSGAVTEVPERIWEPYSDSAEVAANAEHPNRRMRYKLIQSRVTDKNDIFRPLYAEAMALGEARYEELRPLILGNTIPRVQQHIRKGDLSYEELTRFFLYRIYKYELDNASTLNTVLALNPNVLEEARQRDEVLQALPDTQRHPVFGMPILLKDNIGADSMRTTAGAVALKDHEPGNAFIVQQLRRNGALILGKVNLSEWAYYFCAGCPVGYSAIGGQTLNPYGPRVFETGGSSSGSGTSMAAAYAMGAVGTETSGSILSPSGQNSVVGLKPTVGLLGRTGIVPISGTLDTPGPMARTVTDAAVLLDAMRGYDMDDPASARTPAVLHGPSNLPQPSGGGRYGVFPGLLESDSLYREAVGRLREAGSEIIPIEPPDIELDEFLNLLNADMKRDLPAYLSARVRKPDAVQVSDAADVVAFNREDSVLRAPYGQARLEGVARDSTPDSELEALRLRLESAGVAYFETPFEKHRLDAVLSVNNRHAGFAAVAKYPALCVPMGYRGDGEPAGLTFIGRPYQENRLLAMGLFFEDLTGVRRPPDAYKE